MVSGRTGSRPEVSRGAGAQAKFTPGQKRPAAFREVSARRVEPRSCSGPEGDPDPHIPGCSAAWGPRVTHDFSGTPSAESPSPPSVLLSPDWSETERQAPASKEDSASLGVPPDASLPDREPLLGAAASVDPAARLPEEVPQADSQDECPVCTDPYGPGERHMVLLNCDHSLCSGCLRQLLGVTASTDLGRVRCPLCRQKTPMLEWEICRLQEELLQAEGSQRLPPTSPPLLPQRGPGPWGALEYRYQLHFLAGPLGARGCLPFLPCPPCLSAWLWALRERGPCARHLALLSLLSLELLGLLMVFMPLLLLGLLFVLLERTGR